MNAGLEFSGGGWSWALAALAAGALLLHWRRSRAGAGLMCLRAAAAAGLLLAALRPALTYRQSVFVRPRIAVLIDTGHTMQGGRLKAALDWLKKNSAAIEKRADCAVFAVSDRARALPDLAAAAGLKASEAGFHAAESIRDAAEGAGDLTQRAWLLSDGNAEPGEGLERELARFNRPIDVLGVGPERRGPSLSFIDIKTPDFVFLHGNFSVTAIIEASGLADRQLTMRLRKESGAKQWTLVEEKRQRLKSDFETVSASFTAAAQALGRERYRLEISSDDPSRLSSTREVRVETIRQKYRIMYLSGRPSFEYGSLREFLKSDPNHEVVSFVILRNPENPSFVPDNELSLIPFPAEEIFVRSLAQFDLFILENFSYRRFSLPPSYLEALKGFVASGGALLVIGGENAFGLGGYRGTPLEELLPVTLSQTAPDFIAAPFAAKPAALEHPLVRLYETPEASKAAWEAVPPLDGYARFGAVKPQSTVLAVHPQEKTASGQPLPVVAIRDYGRGKVMLLSSDSTWRWKLGAARDWKISSFYSRFWSKAVQYLTGSLDLSKVKFAPLPDHIPPREPALITLRVFDEHFRPAPAVLAEVSAQWSTPDGRIQSVIPRESEPGVFALELTGLAAGTHRLRASARLRGKPWGEDQTQFLWETAPAEPPMDRRWLKKVADATGGEAVELKQAELEALLQKLPAVREESQVRRRFYPWASPAWLWATLGLLILEWALRRLRGHD